MAQTMTGVKVPHLQDPLPHGRGDNVIVTLDEARLCRETYGYTFGLTGTNEGRNMKIRIFSTSSFPG